jgi:hypothetical protein
MGKPDKMKGEMVDPMKQLRSSVRTNRTLALPTLTASVLALLLLGAAGASPARAQGGGADAAKVQQALEARADTQAQSLGLTPDQTKQLVQANATALQSIQDLKANPPSDKKDEMKAIRSIMDTRKATLGKIMTPDQLKQFTANNQQDTASLMTLSLSKDLNLSSDQMDQIDKINLDYIQKMTGALNEKRKVQAARAAKGAVGDKEAALKKVLTPDQWTQYEAMQQQKKSQK